MSVVRALKERWDAPQGYAEILRVGMPLVASMASSTVMQFTDRLFLSKYSVDAIAAALPAALASLTIMLTLLGVCGYSTVLIAQYVGAKAYHRVGSAMWQGIWCAVFGALVMASTWWLAEPLFAYVGHEDSIGILEIKYFRALSLGAGFCLLGAAVGAFYSGRGQTRLVMIANVLGAILNVPLDYLFIFGGLGIPSMGITGAGIATGIGWLFSFVFLAAFVFSAEHECCFKVRSSWRLESGMFRRLLRFGLPSGVNFFMELIGVTWFIFEIGALGKAALAASNIAFSINSLVFTPMLGLNMAVSALVGQAMGRGAPQEAERITVHTLQLAFLYMAPFCLLFVLAPAPLLNLFAPQDMSGADFAAVRGVGVVLLAYIAVYSLVDAGNIVYFGALKGAGDTLGIMLILSGALAFILVLPILALRYNDFASLHTYWIVFTVYVVALAAAAHRRFWRRRWHDIQVIEEKRKC